jgi:hypothetical protein
MLDNAKRPNKIFRSRFDNLHLAAVLCSTDGRLMSSDEALLKLPLRCKFAASGCRFKKPELMFGSGQGGLIGRN